jgi:hypothetical protein
MLPAHRKNELVRRYVVWQIIKTCGLVPTLSGLHLRSLIVHRLLRRSNAPIRGRCCFLSNAFGDKKAAIEAAVCWLKP